MSLGHSRPPLPARVARLIRTIAPLKASQLMHRGRLVMLRRWWRCSGTQIPAAGNPVENEFVGSWHDAGWMRTVPALEREYREELARVDALSRHSFTLLGAEVSFGPRIDWAASGMPRLWRFQLHSFQYMGALALAGERGYGVFRQLALSWIDGNRRLVGDGWHSYTISLRVKNWLEGRSIWRNQIAADAEFAAVLRESMYVQARLLHKTLELDLRGNHLLENLRALVFAGLAYLGPEPTEWLESSLKLLRREAEEQVPPDGGHFERAPGYHVAMLHVFNDVGLVLGANGYEVPGWLREVVGRMARFLKAILPPNCRLPMLKDTIPSGREHPTDAGCVSAAWLGDPSLASGSCMGVEAALRLGPGGTNRFSSPQAEAGPSATALTDSGFYILRHRDDYLIIDCGKLAPEYLPGHAHADTFSYEYHHQGIPVMVDAGVFEYKKGPGRSYFRSTRAHSTLEIDGRNSSEVWDSFRVGRRAKVNVHAWKGVEGGTVLLASHDGYSHLPGRPEHYRCFIWLEGEGFAIVDCVRGKGTHRIRSSIHLHPEVALARDGPMNWGLQAGAARLTLTIAAPDGQYSHGMPLVHARQGWYSPSYGRRVRNPVICVSDRKALPWAAAYFVSSKQQVRLALSTAGADIRVSISTGETERHFCISPTDVGEFAGD